jgi:predicted ABC-type ATPase
MKKADKSYIFDNSSALERFKLLVVVENGNIIKRHASLPQWTSKALAS